MNAPHFESEACFEEVCHVTLSAKEAGKIPVEKVWMGVYYDKEINQAIYAPVEVKEVDPEVGVGVYALKPIAPCAFVGEYTGRVEQKSPRQVKGRKYCMRYTLWQGKKNFVIDAEIEGNFTRHLNHSDEPNLVLHSVYNRGIPRMIFIALRAIEVGEQLTFDYGDLYWKEFGTVPKLL